MGDWFWLLAGKLHRLMIKRCAAKPPESSMRVTLGSGASAGRK